MPIKNTQKQPCEQQNRSFTYLVVSLFSVIISHRPKCSIIKSEPGFSFFLQSISDLCCSGCFS